MKNLKIHFTFITFIILIYLTACVLVENKDKEQDARLKKDIFNILLFKFIECAQSSAPPRVDTVNGQTRIFTLPSYTAVCITQYNDPYLIFLPSIAPKNLLSVFLPGSGGTPIGASGFIAEGAAQGYHSIGLMYPNADPVNVICNSGTNNNRSCFGNVREEVITGIDKSPAVTIDYTNSIDGRLLKLIQYLVVQRPNDGWGQFLTGGQIDWSKVYFSGHSQGSGHAAYQGKIKSLGRVSMYSGVSDYHIASGTPAAWLTIAGSTPASSYFGFIHTGDPVANFSGNQNQVADIWLNSLGMTGALADADATVSPYGNSHRLTTNHCAGSSDNGKHNCTMDISQKAVWDYLSFP